MRAKPLIYQQIMFWGRKAVFGARNAHSEVGRIVVFRNLGDGGYEL
jgi:hypothetical protein